jgi:preprotein translocase subunit SecG
MEKLQLFLLIFQVIIAVIMIILVLLQKSDGDSLSGIGGGSGGLNSVISSRASANLLTKTTMVLIAIFMANCLLLALLSKNSQKSLLSDIDKIVKEQEATSSSNLNNKAVIDNKSDVKSKAISAPEVE